MVYLILVSMHNQEGYGNGDASEKTYMSYPKEHSQSSVRPQAETGVSCKQASVESVLLQPPGKHPG